MTLPRTIEDREYNKFTLDTEGNTAVNVVSESSDYSSSVLITNKIVGIAEASHTLQANVKQLIVRARQFATLTIAFESGATSYIELRPATVLTLEKLNLTGTTLYLKSSLDSVIIEIIELF